MKQPKQQPKASKARQGSISKMSSASPAVKSPCGSPVVAALPLASTAAEQLGVDSQQPSNSNGRRLHWSVTTGDAWTSPQPVLKRADSLLKLGGTAIRGTSAAKAPDVPQAIETSNKTGRKLLLTPCKACHAPGGGLLTVSPATFGPAKHVSHGSAAKKAAAPRAEVGTAVSLAVKPAMRFWLFSQLFAEQKRARSSDHDGLSQHCALDHDALAGRPLSAFAQC